MESNVLFNQILNHESEGEIRKTLIRLIHASFSDENMTVSYFASSDIYYEYDWVEPGAMVLDGYVVEKVSPDAFKVRITASYEEMLSEDTENADFHAPVEGYITYQLTVNVGEFFHTGQGKVYIVPKV